MEVNSARNYHAIAQRHPTEESAHKSYLANHLPTLYFAFMKAIHPCWVLMASGLSAMAAITGQWDFENGDLAATIGTPLQYRGTTASQTQFGTTTAFGIASINGQAGSVMRFPATTAGQGYIVPHGALPNGSGTKVNQYTVVLDILYPSSSTGYRSIWQTDTNNASDGEIFVNGANGIGINGYYNGNLSPDVWHRVAFTIDTTRRELGKYIDGTSVLSSAIGSAPLGTNRMQYLDATPSAVDGRWALDTTALLFADENNETGVGYVSSIQIHDRALAPEEIALLGLPNAAGIQKWSGTGIAQWDFNGNLASSSGGASLAPGAAAPASSPGIEFTNMLIKGQTAQVAGFTRGTFLRLTHGFLANGGGTAINQYTLLMDVMFPSRPGGWAALLQTSPGNNNDGDWFINPSNGLGISGVYTGNVPDGTWNRIALVVDCAAGTYTSYLNGSQVQQISGLSLDGRWALDTTALLFGDEDQENAAGFVNSVQMRDRALTPAELALFGGPEAAGIPLPLQPTGLRVASPNGREVLSAGTTQTITWSAVDPGGLVKIDLLLGDLLYRALGQTLMRQSNFAWAIEPRLGDTNNYRIRLTSLDFPSLQDASDAAFAVTNSGMPPNLLFGQPLQTNGGFESGLANWQVVSGHPVTMTAAAGKGSPASGSLFLHGGLKPGGDMILRQDVDLLAAGFTAADLDGGAVLDASASIRNAYATGTFDSQTSLRVAFLNSSREEIAASRSMVAGTDVWLRRGTTGLLPTGTRALRLEIIGNHRRDADNNSMADDVVARIQRATTLTAPTITKLPLLQDYRQDAMTLQWETDGNLATPTVEWGTSNITEHTLMRIETTMIDSTHFVHRATLTGLAPQTHYTYRVCNGATRSPSYTFRTAPYRNTPFSVAWWGDSQVGPTTLHQMIPDMLTRGVDWTGAAGDVASSGASLYDWHNYWFGALEFQSIGQTHPALFARGNHDGEHPYSYAYGALPGNSSWYAFDYGNSRFIFLDTEASTSASPEQYTWLVSELGRPETRNAAFRVVCFHKPPFANLWNGGGYTGEGWVRNDWVPLFSQHHVDVVINGHAHNYNRGVTNGVTYIVTGGGGGEVDTERVAFWPLFTVEYSSHHYDLMHIDANQLIWGTYDTTGLQLDAFTLTSRVPQLTLQRRDFRTATLVLQGKPGETYVLERGSTPTDWAAYSTNTIPTPNSSPAAITNMIPLGETQYYFRARVQP